MVCSSSVFSQGQRVPPLFLFAGVARATIAAVFCFLNGVNLSFNSDAQAIEHWAVFSVLRSCALVKLYKAVSCTNFWMSSRAVLAVVSWTTCCCRRSKVRASLLHAESVPFFCRRGMSCP